MKWCKGRREVLYQFRLVHNPQRKTYPHQGDIAATDGRNLRALLGYRFASESSIKMKAKICVDHVYLTLSRRLLIAGHFWRELVNSKTT